VPGGGRQLRAVGAGLGRTGTHSLKLALERLTGGPCYHMTETFSRPEHTPVWQAALDGRPPDWRRFFRGWHAAVDWPSCAFWRELAAANPDAPVVLSLCETPQAWWRSMEQTIVANLRVPPPDDRPDWQARRRLMLGMLERRLTPAWGDARAAVAAYERHVEAVRRAIPAERLVEWRAGDGWQPLADALGVAVPDEPFPRTNSTAEFRAASGLAPGPTVTSAESNR
jgi:Sulfotransferase domain